MGCEALHVHSRPLGQSALHLDMAVSTWASGTKPNVIKKVGDHSELLLVGRSNGARCTRAFLKTITKQTLPGPSPCQTRLLLSAWNSMMPDMLQKDERPVAEEIALMGFWAGQVKPLGDLVAVHSWMSCRAECGAGRFRQKGSKPLLLNHVEAPLKQLRL